MLRNNYKIICCYCGHIHMHNDIDAPLENCVACKKSLSDNTSWDSHAVRIFVVDADPEIVNQFIKEVKSKRSQQTPKKRTLARKKSPRTIRKVA